MERELGYSAAVELSEDWEYDGLVVRDEELNGGRVIISRNAETLYVCTDAQAWGTLHTFESQAEAEAHFAQTVAALAAA